MSGSDVTRREALRLGMAALGVSLLAACDASPPDGSGPLIVRDGRLIDGTGKPPIEHLTVVIQGDRITKVTTGPVDVPRGAQVIEAAGLTIMPGLIDMHVHSRPWVFPLFLQFGVATVRDLGSVPGYIYHARQEEQAGRLTAPRIVATGPLLDGTPPIWGAAALTLALASPADAQVAAEQLTGQGTDWLKLYPKLPLAEARAVLDTARAHGVPVAGHVGVVSAWQAVDLGVRTIEHASGLPLLLFDADLESAARLFVGRGAYLDPTLLVCENLANLPTIGTADYPGLDLVPQDVQNGWLNWRSNSHARASDALFSLRQRQQVGRMALVKLVHDMGGNLLVGSDNGNPFVIPGVSLHQEMEPMARAGVPPLSVLHAATGAAAEALNRPELGVVAEGALADLVLLTRDPSEDISATRAIRTVIKGGTVVHAA
jgi:hypothetical protein